MVNIKNTLDELKAILTDIKTKQDAHTAWTGSEKADIEKRLAHVYKKSNPRHTNLTADLATDLDDIENIDKTIGQEKLTTDAQIKKLTEQKTKAETDVAAKDALIKQKDEQIGAKITAELITGLDNLVKTGLKKPKKNTDGTDQKDAQGNIIYEEVIDLSPIKTILEELKTKGISADLTPAITKIDEVKGEIGKANKQAPSWAIYGSLGAGLLTLAGILWLVITRTIPSKQED